MARTLHKLSARKVATEAKPGRYSDGGGLYLFIKASGGKSWVFRYASGGKEADLGLGPVRDVPLSAAREKAAQYRAALANGRNPADERRKSTVPTFGEAALAYIDAMSAAWANPKHRQQWRTTLTVDAEKLASRPVDRIATADVLDVLTPIWQTKPETASRLRGRIEAVLDAAAAKGQRSGDNPARWRGHLQKVLPARQVLSRGHHAALAFDAMPAFMVDLRARQATAARALEFAILTAARTSEVTGATWREIDLAGRVWTVPASRMKAKRDHRVPLSDAAVAVLQSMKPLAADDGAFVFPGARKGRPLSNMAMLILLQKRMGRSDVTAHGFRSAFRDWAGERTSFPREIAEAALAHVNSDKVEAAYRRGDALEKRRALMEAWATFLDCATTGVVVPMARMKP